MKKICLVMAAFCLSAGITACSAEAQGYTKAAVGTQTEQSVTNSSELSSAEAGTKTEEGEQTPGEKTVTGIVEESGADTLVIKAEDGSQFRFSTDHAEVEAGEEGLLTGDKVTVIYTDDGGEWMPAQSVLVSVRQ